VERRKRKRRGSERSQNGSDRTHDGSDRTHIGSVGTHKGSDRTHIGSDRTDDGSDEEEFDLAARFMEPSEGWWTGYGFKSLGEYLRYSETGPDRTASLSPPRKKKNVPAPDLPSGGAPRRSSPFARNRQISIRLDEDGYQALLKAARMYGVAPATMGRLLVVKGARKALESG
jgi:hypothetical protein